MLHCFLDDSGKDSQPTNRWVCIAGYLVGSDAIRTLNEKWFSLLMRHQVLEIHMRDLIPVQGEYKRLGWDQNQRDVVLNECIGIIRETPMTGIGVALETAAWRKLKQENKDLAFENTQQFCLQRILRLIMDRLQAMGNSEQIALVFDTDPQFGANRFNIFCALIAYRNEARRRLSSITFGYPAYYPGLQCADILAWETRKDMGQRLGGHQSTKRWRAMFEAMPEYHLDYIGELWDEANFRNNRKEIIDSFSS
jgi:hypothetical protein